MGKDLITRLLAVLVAAVAYWALLGWDTTKDVDAAGNETGPYSTLQVVVFVLILVALAVWIGLRRDPLVSSIVLAVVTTIDFGISGATSDDSGLWIVGAILVLVGSLAGSLAVSYLAANLTADRVAR